jgi:hypothetical protein
MTYIDNYRMRFNATNIQSTGEAIKSQTISFINNTFSNSPDYTTVLIDNVVTEARILTGKDDLKRELRLLPNRVVNKGMIVSYKHSTSSETNWIIYDVSQNEIFPGGKMLLCNQTLKFKDLLGIDHSLLCHATFKNPNTELEVAKSNVISQPIGDLYVFVKYDNITKDIQSGQRFIISNKAYKVNIYDNVTHVVNGVGLLQLFMELTEIDGNDNIPQGVANNDKPSGTGGKLW